jgi:hypothetical protein
MMIVEEVLEKRSLDVRRNRMKAYNLDVIPRVCSFFDECIDIRFH